MGGEAAAGEGAWAAVERLRDGAGVGGMRERPRAIGAERGGGGAYCGMAYGASGGRGAPLAGRRRLAPRCQACVPAAPPLRGLCGPGPAAFCGAAPAPSLSPSPSRPA